VDNRLSILRAGLLVAFMSAAQPQVAYIHFVGVRPDHRKTALARALYAEFTLYARQHGRELCAITVLGNTPFIRFHERLGFAVRDGCGRLQRPRPQDGEVRRELHQPRSGW
jgi:GNAT superfamily N-acetyltransferase